MLAQFYDLLTELEAAAGKNEKVRLLREKGEPFRWLFELVLSPYITFGVARLPSPAPDVVSALPPLELLVFLYARRLTGNAALVEIAHVRGTLSPKEVEAFDRILLRDLRCGVAASTVNQALPGTVPVFGCQLAPSEMPALSELTFPICAEPKYDGVRTIAIKTNGTVTLYSRNGLPHENFAEINELVAPLIPDDTVLDGEVISPLGFAALMTRAKAKPGKATDVPLRYAVFDALTLDEWQAQECSSPYGLRRTFIPPELVVHSRLCRSADEIEAYYRELLNLGFEGAMLKDLNGPYTFKRNKTWRKLKPFETADLQVIDLIEGTGKYAGKLGALLCEGRHDDKLVLTEVGSGFTDEERDEIWREHAIRWTAEIRFQEVTKAQDSDTFSFRFPSYVRRRYDK